MSKTKLIYISCPIRGLKVTPESYGTPESLDTIRKNCAKAMDLARRLRQELPEYEFHNPANWNLETFVNKAYVRGYLNERQILAVDFSIIEDSNLVIFYNHEGVYSSGMSRELDVTVDNGIARIEVTDGIISTQMLWDDFLLTARAALKMGEYK